VELGVLLGYTDVRYQVLIEKKVIIVRHFDIIEEEMYEDKMYWI